jgi:hypothetical protein
MFCREQAAQLRGIASEAERLGNLVIIGNGTVDHARDFQRTHGDGLRSLVDTGKKTYRTLGFRRGLRYTFGAASVMRGLQTTRRGFTQGATQGDAFQQGGTLVLAAGGRPVYFQRSRFAGDHPEIETVLAAIRLAAGTTSPARRTGRQTS